MRAIYRKEIFFRAIYIESSFAQETIWVYKMAVKVKLLSFDGEDPVG